MATSVGGASNAGVKGRNVDLEINLTGNLRKYIDQLIVSLDKLKKQSGTFSTAASKSMKTVDDGFKNASVAATRFDTVTSRTMKNYTSNFARAHGLTDKLFNRLNSFKGLSILGVGFGVKELISNTKELRQEFLALRGQFAGLSDSQGSASAALKVYYSAWGKTGASFEQVGSAMQALGEKGLTPVDEKTKSVSKQFEDLTALSAQLGQATGISTDAWASLNGQLAFSNKAKVGDIRQINSALIATNMTGGQLTTVMNFVNENIGKYAGLAKDGSKSTLAFTKGIAGAATAMNKLGINAQKATDFIGGLMDPEKFGENQALLSQLGVSYKDYVEMLESGNGKETFFDKIMTQLPEFSQKLAAIRDPFARMNLAKSLGLPVEIMQKMANATPGQITAMMREYQVRAKDEEALKAKQQKMAENAAKLDERFKMIRMKLYTALLPILERNLGTFMTTLSKVATVGGTLFKWIALRVENIFQNFAPIIDSLTSGNFGQLPGQISKGMQNVAGDMMKELGNTVLPKLGMFIGEIMPKIMSGFLSGFWNVFKAMPWWAEMIVGWKVASGALSGLGALASGMNGMINFTRQAVSFFTGQVKGNPVEMAQLNSLKRIEALLASGGKSDGGFGSDAGGGGSRKLIRGRGVGGKLARFGARHGGKILGAAGALVTAGFAASDVMDTNKQMNAGEIEEGEGRKKIGGTIASAGGALGGAAAGAAIGSVVPVIGTLIGGIIGGLVGGLAGPIGEWIGAQVHKEKAGIFQTEAMNKSVSVMKLGQVAGRKGVTENDRGQLNMTMTRDKEALTKNVMDKGGAGGDYTSYMLNTQTGVYEAQKMNAKKYLGDMLKLEQEELEKMAKVLESRKAAGLKLTADDEAILQRKKDIGNREAEYQYQTLELRQMAGEKLNEEENKRLINMRGIHETNMAQWATGVKNGMEKISAGFKANYEILDNSIKKALGGAMATATKVFVGGAAAMIQGFAAAETASENFLQNLNMGEKFLSIFGMSGAAEAGGAMKNATARLRAAQQTQLENAVANAKTPEERLRLQIATAKKFNASNLDYQLTGAGADAGTKASWERFKASNAGEADKLKKQVTDSFEQGNKQQIQRWEEQLRLMKQANTIGAGSLGELKKMNEPEKKATDDSWAQFMKNSVFFGSSMLG